MPIEIPSAGVFVEMEENWTYIGVYVFSSGALGDVAASPSRQTSMIPMNLQNRISIRFLWKRDLQWCSTRSWFHSYVLAVNIVMVVHTWTMAKSPSLAAIQIFFAGSDLVGTGIADG